MATTSEDVWRLLAELATAQKETDKQLKETDLLLKEVSQQQKENAQQIKETDRQQQKTDKQLKELGQQIGGLGAKFGSFTEGLALPSMETILRQRFGMKVVNVIDDYCWQPLNVIKITFQKSSRIVKVFK